MVATSVQRRDAGIPCTTRNDSGRQGGSAAPSAVAMVRQFSCMEATYARDELNCVPRAPPCPACRPVQISSAVVSSVNVGVGMPFSRPPCTVNRTRNFCPHMGLAGSANEGGDQGPNKRRRQPCRRSGRVTLSVVHPDAGPVHPGGRNNLPTWRRGQIPLRGGLSRELYRVEVGRRGDCTTLRRSHSARREALRTGL